MTGAANATRVLVRPPPLHVGFFDRSHARARTAPDVVSFDVDARGERERESRAALRYCRSLSLSPLNVIQHFRDQRRGRPRADPSDLKSESSIT